MPLYYALLPPLMLFVAGQSAATMPRRFAAMPDYAYFSV